MRHVLCLALAADLHLRQLAEADADELFTVVDANRAYLGRWLPWVERTREPSDSLQYIQAARERFAADEGVELAIIHGRAIVGMVGVSRLRDSSMRSAAIGYWLAEDAQGKGTMTAAVSALLEHAFTSLHLDRVEIRAAPENRRSRAIPERLGFREEGRLREAERDGERSAELVVYVMLAHEWRTKPS